MNNKDLFLKQLEGLINEYNSLVASAIYHDFSDLKSDIRIPALLTKSLATIERIAGIKSEYYNSIQIAYKDNRNYYNAGLKLKYAIGIVNALKDDLFNDYLISLKELIHSDVFSDYLEMAHYLLSEGYKDPAAVIVGSTLESHLRKLCEKNSIAIEYKNSKEKIVSKKADLLNDELSKDLVYNKTFQIQITAWLDLRNNAAHGKYNEYSEQEVKLMISGIMNFMQTYSA